MLPKGIAVARAWESCLQQSSTSAKELPMTTLRQRMMEDMQVRSLSPQTQATYVQQVSLFARHFNRSPELLGPEDIRSYQIYLTNDRKLAPSSISIAISALRFFYRITLHKDWSLTEVIPTPKKPQKLPIVPSPEEVLQFLGCVWNIKHRTILTVCYAAGLRVSEAVCLKVSDIDSSRMVIRVEQGKGRIDRYVMLSPKLLQILRDWWRVDRPQRWLFPGDQVDKHIGRCTIEEACQKARRRCRIFKTHYTSFFTACLCRSSAGIGHRRAHNPAAAGSLQPRYHGHLSADRQHQGMLY
jgi:integrase/recombinase XerD